MPMHHYNGSVFLSTTYIEGIDEMQKQNNIDVDTIQIKCYNHYNFFREGCTYEI